MEMAREPGQRGAPPAGGRRAGPRRPLAPRTNPANNAPAQRAAQLPGRGPGCGTQRGPASLGRRRRVGATEEEDRPGPGWGHPASAFGHVHPQLGALKGPQRAAGTGRASEGAQGRRNKGRVRGEQRSGERELAGGREGAMRPEIGGGAAGFGEVGPPRGPVGALSAVLAARWPRGTGAPRARGQLRPEGHLPQPRTRWAAAMATREGWRRA